MLSTLKTLMVGQARRTEEHLQDHYAIELIAQKIREADDGLKAAKMTLASLIQRQRSEARQVDALKSRIAGLTDSAKQAVDNDKMSLAQEAATAIATMENELTLREGTLERLDQKVVRLRATVEATHRRIIDLKQGQTATRAARKEAELQSRLNRSFAGTPPAQEAEELIERVLGQADPLEQSEILQSIDDGLDQKGLEDRLAEQGLGPATKTTAADVLARLQS